jgi:hypothetical protein
MPGCARVGGRRGGSTGRWNRDGGGSSKWGSGVEVPWLIARTEREDGKDRIVEFRMVSAWWIDPGVETGDEAKEREAMADSALMNDRLWRELKAPR